MSKQAEILADFINIIFSVAEDVSVESVFK